MNSLAIDNLADKFASTNIRNSLDHSMEHSNGSSDIEITTTRIIASKDLCSGFPNQQTTTRANDSSQSYDLSEHPETITTTIASKLHRSGSANPRNNERSIMPSQNHSGSQYSEITSKQISSLQTENGSADPKTTTRVESPISLELKQVQRRKDFKLFESVNNRREINLLEGLELHTNIFNSSEQKEIVRFVYQLQQKGRNKMLKQRTYLETGKARVTIQFGCCFNYRTDPDGTPPGINQKEEVDPIPPMLKSMIKRMVEWHVLPSNCIPNSCIVNIYEQGEFIPPHVDHRDFLRPFCTVSFLSECNILFGSKLIPRGNGRFKGLANRSTEIPLPVGSVLVLSGNSADVAKHCVPAVPAKRISITFRRMQESKIPYLLIPDPELQSLQSLKQVPEKIQMQGRQEHTISGIPKLSYGDLLPQLPLYSLPTYSLTPQAHTNSTVQQRAPYSMLQRQGYTNSEVQQRGYGHTNSAVQQTTSYSPMQQQTNSTFRQTTSYLPMQRQGYIRTSVQQRGNGTLPHQIPLYCPPLYSLVQPQYYVSPPFYHGTIANSSMYGWIQDGMPIPYSPSAYYRSSHQSLYNGSPTGSHVV